MTAAERTFLIKRALLRSLADCGGFLLLDPQLREAATIKVDWIAPAMADLDAALREIDTDRLATAVQAERGRKWKLTDAGRAWLAENP